MKEFPLVSIIIPAYNAAPYLEETVQSVLHSDYPHVEIIILNDGSKDDTFQVMEKVHNQHPKIRIYSQENAGAAATRNRAIDLANGKYILPLDADDLISPDYISLAVEVLEKHPEIKAVYGKAEFIGDRTGPWILPAFSTERLAIQNLLYISALFRKDDFQKAGGFCETIPGREDWDFWISMLKDGSKVHQLDASCFFYRQHTGSKRVADRQFKKEAIAMLNQRHAEFFKQYLGGKLRRFRQASKLINFFCR